MNFIRSYLKSKEHQREDIIEDVTSLVENMDLQENYIYVFTL